MKVIEDEEKWKEVGYAKLYMNFVHYWLNDSKSLLFSDLKPNFL